MLLLLIVVSCNNAKNDDDDDDNDDSIDDDDSSNGGPIPTDDDAFDSINENWEWEIVDDRADDFALALNDDNQPVIIYSKWEDLDSYKIIFAIKDDDVWQKQLIADGLHEWRSPGLDVDVSESGDIYLGYLDISTDNSENELLFGRRLNDDWNYEVVSRDVNKVSKPTLVGDNLGFSYVYNYEEENLVVWKYYNNTWNKQIVDPDAAKYVHDRDIVVKTHNNNIYLLYINTQEDYYQNMLIYSTLINDEYIEVISFNNASNPSMDIDSSGYTHLCYIENHERIIYSTDKSGVFVSITMNEEYFNWEQALAVDNNDHVHIIHSGDSLYENNAGTFYINNVSGEWKSEEIGDGPHDVIALQVDDNNVLHALLNIGGYLCHLTREIEAE